MNHRIVELRKARGWTQQQLADALDTTQATVSRLETSQDLTVDWMQQLARAFGCNPIDLLTAAVVAEIRDDVELHEPTGEPMMVRAMQARGLYTYKVLTNVADQVGLAPGSIMLVDTTAEALSRLKDGDVVIAHVRARSGEASGLVLRRFLAPDLLTTHRKHGRDASLKLGDPEFEVEIRGVKEPAH